MPKLDRFKIENARRLRAQMTDEERILWSQIWRIPVEGTHFRRQGVLGRFHPDFVSHRLKLVIELDGRGRMLFRVTRPALFGWNLRATRSFGSGTMK